MKIAKKKILQLSGLLLLSAIFYFHFQSKSFIPSFYDYQKNVVQPSNFSTLTYFDIKSLQLIYICNLCLFTKPKVVFLVTSHVQNIKARNIIRQSYPKDLFKKFSAQIIFLLAVGKNSSDARRQTGDEFQQYGDLVQGDFVEAYRNLTLKHLMGFSWVHNYCSSVINVVKMDDDIVLNYYKLFEIINRSKFKFDLLGHVLDHMKPIRDVKNKWYVSETEFEGEEYPAFLSGWVYVATMKAISLILRESTKLPLFWIDDVFVTGVLRKKAGLQLFDIKQHFRYEPKNIECCVLNKYTCDFLAAPNGKDYELNLQLSNHLWECRYKKKCFMETSFKTSCWSVSKELTIKGQLVPIVLKQRNV